MRIEKLFHPTFSTKLFKISLGYWLLFFNFFYGAKNGFANSSSLNVKILPGGYTLIVQSMPGSGVIDLNSCFKVGNIFEKSEDGGLAHLLSRMFFKSSKNKPTGEIDRQIKLMGARSRVKLNQDFYSFNQVVASEHLEKSIEIHLESLFLPVFNPKEFEGEKNSLMETIKEIQAQPKMALDYQMFKESFQGHLYERGLPEPDSVASLTQTELQEFYKKNYFPDNYALIIVGEVDPGEVYQKTLKIIEKLKLDQKKGKQGVAKEIAIGGKYKQGKEKSFAIYKNVELGYAQVFYHLPSLTADEWSILEIFSGILGMGQSSRLNRILIQENAMANRVETLFEPRNGPPFFRFFLEARPSKMIQALKGLNDQIDRLTREPPGEEEIKRVRAMILSREIFQRETQEAQAKKIGEYWVLDKLEILENFQNSLRSVTPTQIQEFAAKYFLKKGKTTGILWPESLKKTRYQKVILPNEIKILLKEDHGQPIVSVSLLIDAGSRLEPRNKAGLAYLLQKLLWKGTKTKNGEQIASQLDMLGTSPRGETTHNFLHFGFNCLSGNFDESFALFLDCLTQPEFPIAEFEKEKKQVLSTVRKLGEDPVNSGRIEVLKVLFPEHPLGNQVVGHIDTIESLTREDVVQYYQKYFHPKGYTLSLVGDFYFQDELKLKIEETLGKLLKKEVFYPQMSLPKPLEGVRDISINLKNESNLVFFANQTFPYNHPDMPGIQLANAILSGSLYSRLTGSLRDKFDFFTEASTTLGWGKDTGFFLALISTVPGKKEEARKGLLEELQKFSQEGPTQQEVEDARNFLIGSNLIRYDSSEKLARAMAYFEFMGVGFEYAQHYSEKLKSLSADEIKRIAKQWILTDRYVQGITVNQGRTGQVEK